MNQGKRADGAGMDLLADLKQVPAVDLVPEAQLSWLAAQGELARYEPGEFVVTKGEAVTHMFVILEGRVRAQAEANGSGRPIAMMGRHAVSGVLPFSRMKEAGIYGLAMEPTLVFRLHRDHFPAMVNEAPELVKSLVEVMTNRVREFTSAQEQNEKLVSLGKLAAGLAHELNNPASAIVRSAAQLKQVLRSGPERIRSLAETGLDKAAIETMLDFACDLVPDTAEAGLDPLERNRREEEAADWLDGHGADGSAAATLVEAGLTTEDLENLGKRAQGPALAALTGWLEGCLASAKLIGDIEEAARRITALVGSVKSYSHMDRAPEREPVDLAAGIRSTLTMLGHKIREKKIKLALDLAKDLPKVPGWADELNQVWTNLIDNAVDAMPAGGELSIAAAREDDRVAVRVGDTGSGIAKDDIVRIFEPFYTTKQVGHGTGLGLDIVRRIAERHAAEVKVESAPGRTTFCLKFPLT